MFNYSGEESYGEDRCCNSIVTLGGEPNWVLYFCGKNVRGKNVYTGDELDFPLEELDPTPQHIGYTNFKSGLLYLTRMPFRQWKQGIRVGNIGILGEGSKCVSWVEDHGLFSEQAFYKAYMNDYPSLENILGSKNKHKAFSREYCVKEKGTSLVLLRRQVEVGSVNDTSGILTLNKEYSFLQEELEETTNAVV